ncbi:uncharacterized protein [Labrus bergylta]|uniref:uncharacterized protein n=1 Tax=Labrus bergylta TaxID=56723 RepID=UPI003313A6F6
MCVQMKYRKNSDTCNSSCFMPPVRGRCEQTQCFLLLPPLNMAEVRQRFGRGAYDLVLKISNRHRLESQKKHSKTFMSSSSLSPGFLHEKNLKGELCGAQSAAERVTAGGSQDSYTTGFGNVDHVCEKENNAECSFHLGLKRCSLSNKACLQNIEGNCPQHKRSAVFKRSFCTFGTAPSKRGEFVFVRAYSGTRSEPLYKTKTGYYEILEVTSDATQAQIKTAYYKQSFVYHPDRNAGSDAATVRFSEISEAYTVLGNKALKKKYDRGLLSQSDLTASVRPSSSSRDTSGSAAKQQPGSRRHSVLDRDNRGGVFDFDRFFKEHYGEQLQRQKDVSARKEELLKRKHESIADKKLIGVTEVGLMLMLLMAVTLIVSLKRGH